MVATVLRYVELAFFILVGLATIARWIRQRGAPEAWLAATFGLLGGLSALGGLLPQDPQTPLATALVKLFIGVLLLFPYCLYRFMASFEQPPRSTRLIALGLVGTVLIATALLPRVPKPTEPRSAVFGLYVLLIVAEWVFLCGVVCVRLWRAGRDLPAVAKRRTRLLAAGAGVMAVDLALSGLTPAHSDTSATTVAVEIIAIVSVALFFVGFAPPHILLKTWRRADENAFQDAMVELVQATTPEQVVDGLMPHIARLVGAKGIELHDAAGALLGRTGDAPAGDAGRMTLALPSGRLEIWSTPYTPFFGRDELDVLRSLGSLLLLTLERTKAHERELQAGDALAEAQQIAQLGSWRWDITGSKYWSEQMFRIHGLQPDGSIPSREVYESVVHPDDRALALSQLTRSYDNHLPLDNEFRIVLPDGEVRWLHSLGRVIVGADGESTAMYGTCQDITDRREMESSLTRQSLHDNLTGLPNRALFLDRLTEALTVSLRAGTVVAVLFVDIDRFKLVNDSMGHEAGDEVLLDLARRLPAMLRPGDTVARFGGDEFVLLCSGLVDAAEALVIADRLQSVVSRPMTIRGAELVVSVSTGIALASGGTVQPGSLLRDADAAMYRAKELGRGRSVLFADTMRTQVVGRLDTEMELRRAVALDQLRLHYQPIMNLDTETIIGFEALVRWQHPTRGLVPPDEFIGIAEETGLIVPLGEWVLERACEQLLLWQARSPECHKLGMAVNLSAVQIAQPGFTDRVAEILARVGIEPSSLELEITESVLMRDAQATLILLRSLKDQGIRLSIDDFGTGYSSLAYLKRFPVDTLKIDRAFVAGLGRDPDDSAIVQAIQALAATLGMATVAEGLETAEQLDVLVRLGCDKAQGYYFSRAQPAHDLSALLDRVLPVTASPARTKANEPYGTAGADLAPVRSVR